MKKSAPLVYGTGPRKLFVNQEDLNSTLVGVIVSIRSGSSYDPLFEESPAVTVTGERISTYLLDGEANLVLHLHDLLAGICPLAEALPSWQNLVDDINHVDPDSVTFNWECCSGCSDSGFGCTMPQIPNAALSLMGIALRRGHAVMCSDFSLKALISEWSEEILGPNPFAKVSTCDQQLQLEFLPADLQQEDVPQQLQVVGELCREQGKAIIGALSDTIVYTLNPRRQDTQMYSLKVLTVMTDCGGFANLPEAMMCSIGSGSGEKRGMAGHVLLTYASGGQLITSMGHWVELTRINTSTEALMHVAARNFGSQEAAILSAELASKTTNQERSEYMLSKATEYIHKSAPCSMKTRTKYTP